MNGVMKYMKPYLCTFLVILCGGLLCFGQAAVDPDALRSEAMRRLKLSNCAVQSISLSAALANSASRRTAFEFSVELDGTNETVHLEPHSLRSPDFKLFVQRGGALVEEASPPPATWRGHVRGRPGSTVTAAIHDGEMAAVVNLPGGPAWVVESLRRPVPHSPKGTHAIFRADAALPVAGRCSVNSPEIELGAAPAVNPKGPARVPTEPALAVGPTAAAAPVNFYYAEIAFDTDVEYYFGSVQATMAHIEALINAVDAIYARDVQIGYLVTAIIIRTQEPDPYTTDDSEGLLDEFAGHWNSQMGSVRRDVAHLLTGRDLDGAGPAIGIGSLDTICNVPSQAYGLSGNYIVIVPGFTREVITMAHELGHGWGANHCGVTECGIMAQTGSLLQDYFGDISRAEIISHRTAYPQCLVNGLIYVDWQAVSPFWGTALHPFRTVLEGANAAPNGGRLVIRGPHSFAETFSVNRAMSFTAEGGAVTIGREP